VKRVHVAILRNDMLTSVLDYEGVGGSPFVGRLKKSYRMRHLLDILDFVAHDASTRSY
jgi:hypothetical protein